MALTVVPSSSFSFTGQSGSRPRSGAYASQATYATEASVSCLRGEKKTAGNCSRGGSRNVMPPKASSRADGGIFRLEDQPEDMSMFDGGNGVPDSSTGRIRDEFDSRDAVRIPPRQRPLGDLQQGDSNAQRMTQGDVSQLEESSKVRTSNFGVSRRQDYSRSDEDRDEFINREARGRSYSEEYSIDDQRDVSQSSGSESEASAGRDRYRPAMYGDPNEIDSGNFRGNPSSYQSAERDGRAQPRPSRSSSGASQRPPDRSERFRGSGDLTPRFQVEEPSFRPRGNQQRDSEPDRGQQFPRTSGEVASRDLSVLRSNFRTSPSPPAPAPAPSSTPSPTELFEDRVSEAMSLLREGRMGIDGAIEVGVAEEFLYESVRLFEAASALNPKDTTVIGQCGNALLAHGELKLKIARQIRGQVPPPPPPPPSRPPAGRGGSGRDAEEERWRYEEFERERGQAIDVVYELADECEMLLIEAGRKYRASLTLDNRDVKSLHNWGLALWLRGQLIVDEGEEGSMETADKMFLAAIDKYETMLATSDRWRINGLLHWGLALRDRSRLRPMDSQDRMRLMQQARELFAEAVRYEPDNTQAKGGVLACDVELKSLVDFLRTLEMPKRKEVGSGQILDRGNQSEDTSWW